MGFIQRALQGIFCNNDEHATTNISLSFFEIYNERVYDLLNGRKNPLQVKGLFYTILETYCSIILKLISFYFMLCYVMPQLCI